MAPKKPTQKKIKKEEKGSFSFGFEFYSQDEWHGQSPLIFTLSFTKICRSVTPRLSHQMCIQKLPHRSRTPRHPKFAAVGIDHQISCARSTFKDNYEALVEALLLALIAPSDKKAAKAIKLAESFSASLSEEDVAKAKKVAKKRFSRMASVA